MEPIGRSGERDDGLEKLEAFIAQLGASGSEFEKLAEEFGELKGGVGLVGRAGLPVGEGGDPLGPRGR